MQLYPRLRLVTAKELARTSASLSVEALATRSALKHPDAAPAPTGGQAATDVDLERLRRAVREEATRAGYPGGLEQRAQQDFDARVGRLLLDEMRTAPNEASHVEMWAYLGCVLLPDIVRWRYPGSEATTEERFIGGARGIRNTFGRLWWRAYLIEPRTTPGGLVDPLVALNEDELVQITERPGLSGYRALATELAHAFLEALASRPGVPRERLMRESVKRLLRSTALIAPETLQEDQLKTLVSEALRGARQSLASDAALLATRGRAGHALHESEASSSPHGTEDRQQARYPSDLASPTEPIRSTGSAHTEPRTNEAERPDQEAAGDHPAGAIMARGHEVIDLRSKGGRLWVVGGPELADELRSLAPSSQRFVFAPNGAGSTGRRAAWYLFRSP